MPTRRDTFRDGSARVPLTTTLMMTFGLLVMGCDKIQIPQMDQPVAQPAPPSPTAPGAVAPTLPVATPDVIPGVPSSAPAQVDNAQALAAFVKKAKTGRLTEFDLNDFSKIEGTAGLDEIRELKFAGAVDTSLVHLSRFTKVTSLTLDGCVVSNAVGAVIKDLPDLQVLGLNYTSVNDQVILAIASKPGLVELRLAKTGITDAGLNELEKLHNLEILDITGTQITGAGFERFRDHRKLRELRASECRMLQSEAFKFLTGSPLEVLELNATGIADPAMVFISKMKRLKKLTIGDCAISDEGIKKLVGLKDLEYIDVHNLGGVSGVLFQKLIPCKNLKHVNVRATRITPADCLKFEKLHPGCEIVR